MDRKYLCIMEDGGFYLSGKFTNDDRNACDDGVLLVIDVTGSEPVEYYRGEWIDIESVDNG